MEITINLIIGTSGLLAILAWVIASHYFRHTNKRLGSVWLVVGLLVACLTGFFIHVAIPLWTSL